MTSGAEAPRARLLYGLAFVSGFAALVYQVAWSSLLALSFGSSTLAVSAVVAGFMGGMGLGAWRWHRVAARVGAPLRAYAGLEVGIAVTAFVFTGVFERLPPVLAASAAWIPAGLGMDLARVAGVVGLLALPAALMGATYPALCMALIRTRRGVDRHLGLLYGLNTVGAAAGALAAGFVLLEWLGARGAVLAGNLLNLGVAAAAWREDRAATPRGALGQTPIDEPVPTALPQALTAAVLFGSGFATLAYEILWFRALRYLVGNGTYALSTALVIFLLGLGLGALLYRPLVRRAAGERALGLAQLGIAVLALAAVGAELAVLRRPELRESFSVFSASLRAQAWWWRLLAGGGVAVAVMLPATLLMGLCFPLASRLFLGSVARVGPRVGMATLLANLGSISGAVLAAVAILPRLGTVRGTLAVAGLNLVLGLAVLARQAGRRPVLGLAGLGAAAALAAGAAWLPPRMPFRGEPLLERLAPRLLFEEEAELGTVQVRGGADGVRAMIIDGAMIAGSRGLEEIYRKQLLLAHLPMLLRPAAQRTLNVGVASGSTLLAMAAYDSLQRLDAVEINPAVMHGIAFFDEARVLQDPRVDVAVEDAVHYLLRSPVRWDLIVSDAKQNRDFSGNAKILSREFYTHAAARLARCGAFFQWIPLSNDPESFRLILRTFAAAFPRVAVFYDPPESLYMAGSACALERDGADAAFPPGHPAAELEAFGLDGPADVLGLWIADGEGVRRVVGEGRLNTWDRLPVAFESYRARPARSHTAHNLELLVEARRDRTARGAGHPFLAAGSPLAASRPLVQDAVLAHLEGEPGEARRLARAALARNPDDAQAVWALRFFAHNPVLR